jgi:hypothetical protein
MNGFGIHGVTAKSDTNEHKIAYYQEINSTTGTVTVPTGGTILLNQLAGGADALVSTIDGVPTGSLPQTAGGVQVDVTSFDSSGNYVLSGTPSSYPVALIYWLKISGADYSNLTTANIIEENIPLLVDNIYTADGTLTGDRTITGGGNDISFSGGSGGSKVLLWNGDDLDISGTDGQFTTGQVHIHGTRGMSSPSHGKGQFYFASTYDNAPYINRNIADANPALIIDQEHAGSTGDIAQFWNSTGTVASITNDGYITAQAATGTSDTVAIWDGTTLKKKELIIESGTYTPTVAGLANVDATTANECQYMRVGDVVTVSGRISIDATATGTLTRVSCSLPIASTFTDEWNLGGTGSYKASFSTNIVFSIYGGSNFAEFRCYPSTTGNMLVPFSFTYIIK